MAGKGKTLSVSAGCYAQLVRMKDHYGLSIPTIIERLVFGPALSPMPDHEDLLEPQREAVQ